MIYITDKLSSFLRCCDVRVVHGNSRTTFDLCLVMLLV